MRATVAKNAMAKQVCIVGAGASGLVSAKVLREAGLSCTIIEQRNLVGGVWSRDEANVGRHENPIYDSLRTNLPKELMQFDDFEFSPGPSFVGHADVQSYLQSYAAAHGLDQPSVLRLGYSVHSIRREAPGRWAVACRHVAAAATAAAEANPTIEEIYDAVVVCNGHYFLPIVPALPGQEAFEAAGGRVLHSSVYREPAPHVPARGVGGDSSRGGADGSDADGVLVVGSGPSGMDISMELAQAGGRVTLSVRGSAPAAGAVQPGADPPAAAAAAAAAKPPSRGVKHVPGVKHAAGLTALHADRCASFEDGSRSGPLSAVVLATGFECARTEPD